MQLEQRAASGLALSHPVMMKCQLYTHVHSRTMQPPLPMHAQVDLQSEISTVLVSHTAASIEGFAVGWHAGGELQVPCG